MAASFAANQPPLRVLLGGMRPWQAQVLGDFIGADPALEVIGAMADAAQTIAASASLTPDVVVLDFHVSGLGGLETTRRVRVASPTSRVVLLGDAESTLYVDAAHDAGACTYLPWLSVPPILLAAVHGAAGCARGTGEVSGLGGAAHGGAA